jgi:electron transfer flavoprotein alpha subunit
VLLIPREHNLESLNDASKLDLTEADVVVSGGRGMGGPDFSVLERLADAGPAPGGAEPTTG